MMANSSPPSRASTSISRKVDLQAAAGLLEQSVAGRVAERIVDVLESVEVEHEDRERLVSPAQPGGRLLELLDEIGAIGEAGQEIVVRHEGDLLLVAPPVGDVLVDRNPAAFRDRLRGDADHASILQFVDGGIGLVAGNRFDAPVDVFLRGFRVRDR